MVVFEFWFLGLFLGGGEGGLGRLPCAKTAVED